MRESLHQFRMQVTGYLPVLLGAALVLVVGTLIAVVVSLIVRFILKRTRLDNRLYQRARRPHDLYLRPYPIEKTLSLLVFWGVEAFVIVATLDRLGLHAVSLPLQQLLNRFLMLIPNVIAAIILIALAWFVGKLIAGIVQNALENFGFDDIIARLGVARKIRGEFTTITAEAGAADALDDEDIDADTLDQEVIGTTPSAIVANIGLCAIVLLAMQEAFDFLHFARLAAMTERLLDFLGHVVLGLILICAGFYFANLAARLIRQSGVAFRNMLARFVQGSIIVLSITMALEEMGLGSGIVMIAFSALMLGVGLAVGLAFGLGGRDEAKRIIERVTANAEGERAIITTSSITKARRRPPRKPVV